MESVADKLPSLEKVTQIYQPKRSGYIGLDGFWLKLKGESFVVLVAFDVQTLDIIAYHVSTKEDRQGWLELINKCGSWLSAAKGFYIDGELSLVSVIKDHFPHVPTQLCVFHKEIRIGQIMPLVHLKTEEDKWLKKVFEIVLYNPCEKTVLRYFYKLKIAKTIDKTQKKKKVFGVLNRNFDLLMTHHDHPEMHKTNNVLEGFNGNIKQKLKVMRGIKKEKNVDRYLKLIFLDYRFRKIKNSNFKSRNHKNPLELSSCKEVPTNYHWIEKHISAR